MKRVTARVDKARSTLKGRLTGRTAGLLVGAAAIPLCSGVADAKAASGTPDTSAAYFLPKLEVEVIGSFRLVSCVEAPVFRSELAVVQKYVPDPAARVNMDLQGALLANRSLKLEYYPDGTLKAFNGSSEGQGAKLVTAAIKLGLNVLGFPTGIPTNNKNFQTTVPISPLCARAEPLLTNLAQTDAQIGEVEARLAGTKPQPTDLRTRDILLQKKAELLAALTATQRWPVAIPYRWQNFTCETSFAFSQAPDYSRLLDQASVSDLPAYNGITVKFCPTEGIALEASPVGALQTALASAQTNVIYRVPVPASITVSADNMTQAGRTSRTVPIIVPQWAKLSQLRIGGGGFRSRQASAKFDPTGMPSEIAYSSTAMAAAGSELLDTARAGFSAISNAELNRLKAEIELEEARQKLESLRAAAAID